NIMIPYATVGNKINAILYSHFVSGPIIRASIPPNTNPPGQPAWRIFSHFVFSRGNMVATTGFTAASTVPLPSATMNVPTYNIQYPFAKIVITAEATWQIKANTIAVL